MSWLSRLFSRSSMGERTTPVKVQISEAEDPIYAVGDVHGRLDLLLKLEGAFQQDLVQSEASRATIVLLGDMIDRGPQSGQVLDHLTAPPPTGFDRVCLAGNHELAMLNFLKAPDRRHEWLGYGGLETLASYGVSQQEVSTLSPRKLHQRLAIVVPEDHTSFLAGLPHMATTPTDLFVHAGLRHGVSLEKQSVEDLTWFRDGMADDFAWVGKRVVHGHTPQTQPYVSAHRICVDTGAFSSGTLTAVRLWGQRPPSILTARATPENSADPHRANG